MLRCDGALKGALPFFMDADTRERERERERQKISKGDGKVAIAARIRPTDHPVMVTI